MDLLVVGAKHPRELLWGTEVYHWSVVLKVRLQVIHPLESLGRQDRKLGSVGKVDMVGTEVTEVMLMNFSIAVVIGTCDPVHR